MILGDQAVPHPHILQLNPPDDPSVSLFNGNCGYCTPANAPVSTLANPVSSSIPASVANIVSIPPGRQHPDLYLQTWNLTFSKQIGNNVMDVSYVGVKGSKEDTSLLNFNVGPPQAPGGNVQANRPYPQFGQMRVLDNHGASIYEGLLLHLQHRLSHGLFLNTAYALSSLRDDQGGGTNQQRNETQNPFEKVWAHGLTEQRNNLSIAVLYNIPQLSENRNAVERRVLGGWAVSGIFQYYSGSPQFVSQSDDGQNNGNNFEYPDLVPGQPNGVPHRSINEWFNTARFTEAIGHYGNAPRNPSWVVAPSNSPLVLELKRVFTMPFAESQKLSLQLQAFNALNHPQFGPPNANQSSGSFGTITSTTLDNRQVQLVAKYFF